MLGSLELMLRSHLLVSARVVVRLMGLKRSQTIENSIQMKAIFVGSPAVILFLDFSMVYFATAGSKS